MLKTSLILAVQYVRKIQYKFDKENRRSFNIEHFRVVILARVFSHFHRGFMLCFTHVLYNQLRTEEEQLGPKPRIKYTNKDKYDKNL